MAYRVWYESVLGVVSSVGIIKFPLYTSISDSHWLAKRAIGAELGTIVNGSQLIPPVTSLFRLRSVRPLSVVHLSDQKQAPLRNYPFLSNYLLTQVVGAMSVKRSVDADASSIPSADISKKPKIDDNGDGHHESWQSFEDFELVKVLNDDAQVKSMSVQARVRTESGEKAESNDAVIVLEKTPFAKDDDALKALLSSSTKLKQVFNNDIYGRYECVPNDNGRFRLFLLRTYSTPLMYEMNQSTAFLI